MNDLFDPQEINEPQIDETQTYYDKLVGPNAKFKDNEALAKGKWYADAMVEIKNKQMDQMRNDFLKLKAESDARTRIEDLIDQLDKKMVTNPETHVPEVKDNAASINPDDIEKLVNRRIMETKAADKAEANFNEVMGKLKERYGTKYRDVLLEQTEAIGLTADDVNALARKSPTAFFKTMGLDQVPTQQPNQTPPRSSATFVPQGKPKKTWSYYQEMFKKDPKLYYDPKMTQEMVESHAALGDEFKDGDFSIYGD